MPKSQEREPFDAIVVGSGFGGAVTACRLVEAGFNVCILERGRRYAAEDFPDLPPEDSMLPDPARWLWRRDQGIWDIRDLGGIQAVGAAGFGGGSLLYANVHLRAPKEVFRPDDPEKTKWPMSREDLDPYYDLVSYMLDLQTIDQAKVGAPTKTRQLDAVAEKLNRRSVHPPLAVHFEKGRGLGVSDLEPCQMCGACCSGCRHRAKNTLDHNYLRLAEHPELDGDSDRGAEVRTLAEVRRFWAPRHPKIAEETAGIAADDDHWLIEYEDHAAGGRRVLLRAKRLFLCAGSVADTELLLRNRDRLNEPKGLAGVGRGYFPNADAAAMVFDTQNLQYPSWGPTITTLMTHHDAERDDWFVVEDGGYDVAFKRLFRALKAPVWLDRNRFDETEGYPNKSAKPERGGDGRQPHGKTLNVVDPTDGEGPGDHRPPVILDGFHNDLERINRATLGWHVDGRSPFWLKGKLPNVLTRAVYDDVRDRAVEAVTKQAVEIARDARRSALEQTCSIPLFIRAGERFLDCFEGFRAESIAKNAIGRAIERFNLDRPEELLLAGVTWLLDYDEDRTVDESGDKVQLLLVMGRDDGPWTLSDRDDEGNPRPFGAEAGGVHSPERQKTLSLYETQTRVLRDIAASLGGELRSNPIWALQRKPITVHSSGGCAMAPEGEPPEGETLAPCDAFGAVRGNEGLYVNDGALFPSAVGVNPSHTIAAVAERNVEHVIRKALGDPNHRARQAERAREWGEAARAQGMVLEVPRGQTPQPHAPLVGIAFDERLTGFLDEGGPPVGSRCGAAESSTGNGNEPPSREFVRACREREKTGRARRQTLSMDLEVDIPSLASFLDSGDRTATFEGTMQVAIGKKRIGHKCPARGTLAVLPIQPGRAVGIESMHYTLTFEFENKSWCLEGWKRIEDDKGPDAWEDTTALFVELTAPGEPTRWGVMRLGMAYFLETMMPNMRVTGTRDTRRIAWTMARFFGFFGAGLQNAYMPPMIRALLEDTIVEVSGG